MLVKFFILECFADGILFFSKWISILFPYFFLFQRPLIVLDVKESPGGVAVGCYTHRIKDRA